MRNLIMDVAIDLLRQYFVGLWKHYVINDVHSYALFSIETQLIDFLTLNKQSIKKQFGFLL